MNLVQNDQTHIQSNLDLHGASQSQLGTISHANITALNHDQSHLNLQEHASESFMDHDATNIQS